MRLLTMLTTLTLTLSAAAQPQMIDIYTSGQDGYTLYRIPAIVVTNEGTILAFAEGRKTERKDNGDIDVLVKRSSDGGQTWSPQQIIWDDGDSTCGNGTAVVDRATGDIWLAMNHNVYNYVTSKDRNGLGTRTAWITRSSDDGLTWAKPTDITSIVKDTAWTWHGVGPGIGIQLQRGPHAGRLLLPAYYNDPAGPVLNMANAFYSDDHGQTWQRSRGIIQPRVGEDQFVELSDGRILANLRCQKPDARRRWAISEDGGDTWSPASPHEQLPDPPCQASLLRYSWPDDGGRSRILFANPANEDGRTHLTLRLSYDEGQTWPVSKLIYEGASAYSCLVRLPDGRIGCLFEADRYSRLVLAIVDLDWLTDGTDTGQ